MIADPKKNPEPSDVEKRLQRLEDALANLHDPRWLGDTIARQVWEHLKKEHNPKSGPSSENGSNGRLEQPRDMPPNRNPEASSSWLLLDLFRDFRAMVQMFFDRKYRVSFTTWFAVIFTLPLILFSHWWFPGAWIPVVGFYLDKIVDVFIAFFAYKALSREARRYQNG